MIPNIEEIMNINKIYESIMHEDQKTKDKDQKKGMFRCTTQRNIAKYYLLLL